jgi:hypothetical protein
VAAIAMIRSGMSRPKAAQAVPFEEPSVCVA